MSDLEINLTESKTKDSLQTGDIILCHGYNPKGLDPGIDGVIEFFTHSPWEHAGMVIKNPSGILDVSLNDGLYILQACQGPNGYPDVINGKLGGITLNNLDDFLCNRQHIYIRSLNNYDWSENQKLNFLDAFNESHGKPYDKGWWNWFCAGINSWCCYGKCKCCKCCVPPHDNDFWCSALVAFMYVKMGCFAEDLDWSDKTPAFLARDDTPIVEPYSLSKLWVLKK